MTHLGKMLLAYEQKTDRSGVQMAAEIGLTKSTYLHIRNGNKPNADHLVKIIAWMIRNGETG